MIKVLILHNGQYKRYVSDSWITVTSGVPTETDYSNGNTLEEISNILESEWSILDGEIEFCYYSDDSEITNLTVKIGTDSFLLEDVLKDDTINIREYSDDITQTTSVVSVDSEPFLIYDEFGNSMNVLYYTDDASVTSPSLEVTTNRSLLDSIEESYQLYSWSSGDSIDNPVLTTTGIPVKQALFQPKEFELHGDLANIIANQTGSLGKFRTVISFDDGNTWEAFKWDEWITINLSNLTDVRSKGMSAYDLSKLTKEVFLDKGERLKLAYYLEDSIHTDEKIQIADVKLEINSPIGNVKFHTLAFYILNTTATISVTFAGNKLKGEIDDDDKGKVQYRVILNGDPYFPIDGSYTALSRTPIDINVSVDERSVLIDQNNTLRVEFKDAWGVEDAWETVFFGTYSGLMFKNSTGEYLTNSLGELLKHLDFGVVIAGQTTLEQQVVVRNQLGDRVQNLQLEVAQDKLPEGVAVQLSRTASPFRAEKSLLFNQIVEPEEELTFYVRLSTQIHAPAAPAGQFEIRANADAL